jgi:hypothetical protein
MIKTIYLHIGVHKTATSSIQKALGTAHELLANGGYLYPVFTKQDIIIYNHSEVFYSMFFQKPETYHMNVLYGYTNTDAVNELNRSYHNQLIRQIEDFQGDKMILSAEDISILWFKPLVNLKNYLVEITNPEVHIEVILFCRHPLTWSSAHVQEVIKGGNSLEEAVKENATVILENYQKKINTFSRVFAFESIHVFRYEDAIQNEYGPAGAFLSCIGTDESFIKTLNLKNELHNVSLSYEATTLLDAIYSKTPAFINDQVYQELNNFHPHLIHQIPGVKFFLEASHNHEIWQRSQDDINWLCENYKLPAYNYFDNQKEDDADKWSEVTLNYLQKILPEQPPKIRKIIITGILTEIIHYKKCFSYQKKQSMFAFFMHHSAYLELASRYSKFSYSCKYLGSGLAFVFGLNYLIRKNIPGLKH